MIAVQPPATAASKPSANGKKPSLAQAAPRALSPARARGDLHGADAIGLAGADAARRAALHDDDAVALHVAHDVPREGEVVPLLRIGLAPANHPPLFGRRTGIVVLGQHAAQRAAQPQLARQLVGQRVAQTA